MKDLSEIWRSRKSLKPWSITHTWRPLWIISNTKNLGRFHIRHLNSYRCHEVETKKDFFNFLYLVGNFSICMKMYLLTHCIYFQCSAKHSLSIDWTHMHDHCFIEDMSCIYIELIINLPYAGNIFMLSMNIYNSSQCFTVIILNKDKIYNLDHTSGKKWIKMKFKNWVCLI